jgi:hypothetical protein
MSVLQLAREIRRNGLPRLVVFGFLTGQAPGSVIGARDGATLRARLRVLRTEEVIEVVIRSLEGACFLETTMSTLFHGASSQGNGWCFGGSV